MNLANNSGAKAASGPKLHAIRPLFIVESFAVSIDYYVEQLGFQLDFQGPEGGPFYGGVSRDGAGLLLKEVLPEVKPLPNPARHEWARWDAFIATSDPDSLYEEFVRRSAKVIAAPAFLDEGLWGVEVDDLDGYRLAFATTGHAAMGD